MSATRPCRRATGRARRRRALAALLLAAAGVAGCSTSTSTVPPDIRAAGAPGISPGYEILVLGPDDLDRELRLYREAGARWLRVDLDWPSIEPQPGARQWDAADRVVDAATRLGLEVLLLADKSPDWARVAAGGQPDVAAFDAFISDAVARYRDRGVHAWEIWNEENTTTFWQADPDPERYAQILRTAAESIRAADPEALTVLGGLAPSPDDARGRWLSPTTYLERVYAAGAAGSFDAVAVHPYSYPALPSQTALPVRHGYRDLAGVRRVMDENGDDALPIWITEVGAPTGSSPRAVSQLRQAQIVAEALASARASPRLGPVFIYSGRDRGVDPADPEDNFGMVDRDFAPKPALAAFTEQAAAFSDQP